MEMKCDQIKNYLAVFYLAVAECLVNNIWYERDDCFVNKTHWKKGYWKVGLTFSIMYRTTLHFCLMKRKKKYKQIKNRINFMLKSADLGESQTGSWLLWNFDLCFIGVVFCQCHWPLMSQSPWSPPVHYSLRVVSFMINQLGF